jgi:hypothetical protein
MIRSSLEFGWRHAYMGSLVVGIFYGYGCIFFQLVWVSYSTNDIIPILYPPGCPWYTLAQANM